MTEDDTRVGVYRATEPTHGGYGCPRGPMDSVESPHAAAIGFCPWCASDARGTCSARGTFDCPTCSHVWYDFRVGEQTYSVEDFLSDAE